MDPPYGAIFLLLVICGLAEVASIVKARRKRENTYYLITAVVFLTFLAVVVALLNQFLLSLVLIAVTGILSIAILPKAMNLYRQEIVKQQETDASTPLSIRDFLTWKAWIKLESTHGFRKMLLLYSLFNIGTIGAILITLTALGIINTVMALRTAILAGIASVIIVYRQIWKAFKK